MTRIIIADDQALFREGLRTLLSTRPDMDVVGEAGSGDEAVVLVEKLQPAVVLMDLRMPNGDGIQATARIRDRWPEIPVLVLTTFDDDANLFGALRAGAAGYLLKDVSSETLVSAIQAARRVEQGDCGSSLPCGRHRQEPRDEHPHQTRRAGPHTGGHPRPSTGNRLIRSVSTPTLIAPQSPWAHMRATTASM